jgi:membrane dipeptidase
MDAFGFTLDVSHMDARAALQSLDVYQGQIIASHANAKTVLKGSSSNRHLTDDIIRGLIERNGVIGVVPYNRFLQHGWTRSDGKEAVGLDALIAQIDYICQMAGNANHVGIGSDFDGGLGWQHVPRELNTIADLQKIPALLYEKGYDEGDVTAIMGGNWIAMLEHTLPETV